jgi:hypothetical protein
MKINYQHCRLGELGLAPAFGIVTICGGKSLGGGKRLDDIVGVRFSFWEFHICVIWYPLPPPEIRL